jgi:hypothetical protein
MHAVALYDALNDPEPASASGVILGHQARGWAPGVGVE